MCLAIIILCDFTDTLTTDIKFYNMAEFDNKFSMLPKLSGFFVAFFTICVWPLVILKVNAASDPGEDAEMAPLGLLVAWIGSLPIAIINTLVIIPYFFKKWLSSNYIFWTFALHTVALLLLATAFTLMSYLIGHYWHLDVLLYSFTFLVLFLPPCLIGSLAYCLTQNLQLMRN